MELIDEGNPRAFYEKIAFTSEEASERISRAGDGDAADLVFCRREPLPWEDTDATLRKDDQIIHYSYVNGKCYSPQGDELPDELADEVRESGLVPLGTGGEDDESLKKLIESCEGVVHMDDITLRETQEGDDD